MNHRNNLWTLCTAGFLLISACAPAATQVGTPVQARALNPTPKLAAQPSQAVPYSIPTEGSTQIPLPVATSRGSNLEATDPVGVVLASGSLHLVEFFRFT